MKSKLLLCLPLVGCLVSASCYRIEDRPRKPHRPDSDTTVTSQDQQKIQEKRDRMKADAEKKAQPDIKPDPENVTKKPDVGVTPPTNKPPEEPKKKSDYAFATPIPGKPGFVFSPYNNKWVDVRDIPSGTLVQDPTYPAADKKYFRVP